MKSITLACPAKINLALNITGKSDNGLHFMEMIMQSVSLFDYIHLSTNNSNSINISSNNNQIPLDNSNIAFKASQKFFQFTNIKSGININIYKNIPIQAGLAGGSADGAGVLIALNKLFNTNIPLPVLLDISFDIGADLPFCLTGGTALSKGFGQIITPLNNLSDCYFVIIKPDFGVSTKSAFQTFDLFNKYYNININHIISFIQHNDIINLAHNLKNVFEFSSPFKSLIYDFKHILINNGAINALMTGTGSAIFGIFNDFYLAKKCYYNLSKLYTTFFCKPICYGPKILSCD